MSKSNFKLGDFLWAKMTGYRPWPAKVIDPPEATTKTPNDKIFVYFFGSKNVGWVREKDCCEYLANREKFLESTPQRNKQLAAACEEIAAEYEAVLKGDAIETKTGTTSNGDSKTATPVSRKGAARKKVENESTANGNSDSDPFLFREEDDIVTASSSVKKSKLASKQNGANNSQRSAKRAYQTEAKTGNTDVVEVQSSATASKRRNLSALASADAEVTPKAATVSTKKTTVRRNDRAKGNEKTNTPVITDNSKDSSSRQHDFCGSPTRFASALRLEAKSRLIDAPPVSSSASSAGWRSSTSIKDYVRHGGGSVGFLLDTDFTEGRALLNAFAALGSRLICQLYTSRPLAQLVSPVSDAADCTFSDSEEQVIQVCDVLVLAIDTPEILDEVLFGAEPTSTNRQADAVSELLASLNEKKLVVALCGSLDANLVADLARRVEARGASFVELQILDGGNFDGKREKEKRRSADTPSDPKYLLQALKNSVAVLTGDEQICQQLSAALTGTVNHCVYLNDQVGSGQRLRLAVHTQQANLVATLSESFSFLDRLGLRRSLFIDLLNHSSLNSKFLLSKANAIVSNQYDGSVYSVASAMHDAIAFSRLAEQTAVCSGATIAAHELLKLASTHGHASDDVAALYEIAKRP